MEQVRTSQDRKDAGKQARAEVPRAAHGEWSTGESRRDPVGVLLEQDEGRLPWLVPVRHQRMAESPFAFYRGAAAVMAADLAGSPTTGFNVQASGDAHLANFGTYASPERRQVFDLNDFDETMRGPWEWDVKRLATSVVLACRDNRFAKKGPGAAEQAVAAYRRAMRVFAAMPILEVWYEQLSLELIRQSIPSRDERKRFDAGARKARARTSESALGKIAVTTDGSRRLVSQPPLLLALRDLAEHIDTEELRRAVEQQFATYRESLASDRRTLLERFQVVDLALKVVGVGSVGTRCWIVLLEGRDHGEPLLLQVKQAGPSVLEPYLVPSGYEHQGERIVAGQRLMQASSDIFLGWSQAQDGLHYYWRQLRDMKGSADIPAMNPDQLEAYAELCGWTLAHAHARSGDAIAISGYLGKGSSFDEAISRFATLYADQTEADHAAFTQAIAEGGVPGPQ